MGMVQDRPFFGVINEDPYVHLEEFEELCPCLVLPGMTQESIRWKLFPLSLLERVEQWYTDTIKSVKGDWGKLRDNFCNSFSLMERTVQWYTHMASLLGDILEFEQLKEESIGAAWARFRRLGASRPDSSLPDDVLLYAFCMSIDMDAAQDLDIAAGGLFAHKTLVEGREILDSFLENSFFPTDHNEPHQESDSIHEILSIAEPEPMVFTSQFSTIEPSPEPGTMEEEEIQPPEFLYQFEDNPL
jgi:hypothetical protein